MGGSYASCYPLAVHLATHGRAALMVGTAELLHFRLGILDPSRPLVAVSQSGESAEIVGLVERLRDLAPRPRLVAVTNGPDNTLAGRPTTRSTPGRGPRWDPPPARSPAPSSSSPGSDGVSIDGVGRLDRRRLIADAEEVAVTIERLLAHRGLGDELFEAFGSLDRFVVLGRVRHGPRPRWRR